MPAKGDFASNFTCLTGHEPFPWQEALFTEFLAGRFPPACDIPTGLGKTLVIAVWLLALAERVSRGEVDDFPRRLVYVVNRRTVVDQATNEAKEVRAALGREASLAPVRAALASLASRPSDDPLAISTLRGELAENPGWRDDPARPAVVIGTVDMIGSRLLFAGYGCGFKSRPLHAGFLAQDTLLVHDEAHLEPAFQDLLTAIVSEQKRSAEFRHFRVMALTATSRNNDGGVDAPFRLTSADRQHHVVAKRLDARKRLAFVPVEHARAIADGVARLALEHLDSGQRILVFLRRLDDVEKVTTRIRANAPGQVQLLTGTLRGFERDRLAKGDAVFARFLVKPQTTPQSGTVFLVCTSAGEVGVDMSADHLVCDLTPFDSMAQRLGRVNRLGDGDARIDLVHSNEAQSEPRYDQACARTLALLRQLPVRDDGRHDASPAALGNLPGPLRHAAFTPSPVVLPVSDILFDAWALTSVRERLPGRPPVTDWLHGIPEGEAPETRVAWREEVGRITGELLGEVDPEDLLGDYPLKPHELLRDRMFRVIEHLGRIAARCPGVRAWLIRPDGTVEPGTLADFVENKARTNLADCMVLLPPDAGGLKDGLLAGDEPFEEARRDLYDVADRWLDENDRSRRLRVFGDEKPPKDMRMRLLRVIHLPPENVNAPLEDEDEAETRRWCWYVRPRSADDDGSRTATSLQALDTHHRAAERFAATLVSKLGLRDPEASAVVLAARCHDLGKARDLWQRSIGNRDYPEAVWAKSDRTMRTKELHKFRHEFGSLIDVLDLEPFNAPAPDVRDLALHLIAAHHGRARPHFPPHEAFDRERSDQAAQTVAKEVPPRFGQLQRKYGRWGLAYIESLVRAADVMASQVDDSTEPGPADVAGGSHGQVQS